MNILESMVYNTLHLGKAIVRNCVGMH